MRSALVTYPVRRISVPTVRRRNGSGRSSTAKMLAKLDAASSRLAASRRRR